MQGASSAPEAAAVLQPRLLNVLILEDSASDAKHLVGELRKAGLWFRCRRVETRPAYVEALETGSYEVVLAAFSLPQFDSFEALEILRQKSLRTPFILVSGEIGEERAVEIIKRGADDYLLKDRLGRLGHAVLQALKSRVLAERADQDEREKTRLLDELRERVKEATTLGRILTLVQQDQLPDAELLDRLVQAIPAGWQFPNLTTVRIFVDDLHAASDAFELGSAQLSRPILRHREVCGRIDIRYLKPREEAAKTIAFLPEEEKLLTSIATVIGNCFARRRTRQHLESSESRYRNLVQSLHDVIWATDEQGCISFINNACRTVFGRAPNEVTGQPFRSLFTAVQKQRLPDPLQAVIRDGVDLIDYETQAVREDGSLLTLITNAQAVRDDSGTITGATGVTRDVSELVALTSESRRQECLLANAERVAQIGSWDYDIRTDRLTWSANTLRMFGIESREFDGSFATLVQRIHPKDRHRVKRSLTGAAADDGLADDGLIACEFRIVLQNGEERVLRERGEVTFDEQGQPIRRTGVVRDVTGDVRIVNALRKSQERYELAGRGSSAGLWDWDLKTSEVFYSQRFKELLGYGPEEFSDQFSTFWHALHPRDKGRVESALRRHFEKDDPYDIDYRVQTKAGHYRWFNARGPVLRDQAGEPVRMAGSLIDVSARRLLEESLKARVREQRQFADQLQDEKRRLAEAQAVAKVGTWQIDLNTFRVAWSDQTHRIFGTDQATFEPTYKRFLAFVHPGDRPRVDDAFQASRQHSRVCNITHRIRIAGGQEKTVEEVWRIFRDEQDKPLRAIGTIRDVTAAAKSKRELASHARGLKAIGRTGRLFLENRHLAGALSSAAEIIRQEMDASRVRFWMLDGNHQTLQVRANAGNGHVEGENPSEETALLGEHIAAQAAKTQTFRLQEVSGNGLNAAFEAGSTAWQAAFPLVEQGTCFGVLEVVIAPDLSAQARTTLEVLSSTIALGIERILSEDAVRQLNEKLERRVEKRTAELAESSRRHETLLANLQGMAFRCRIADGWAMRYVSEGCRQLLGVEPTELISGRCTLFSLIHRADLAEVEHVWEQCIADGRPIQHEYRVLRPDGKQRWVWEQSRLVRGVAGEPEAIEGFITDVTVAKMAALRQANQSRLYELLAVGSPVEDALRHIARSLEAEDPSSYCVISLPEETNGNGGLAAAPSLPAAFKEALVVDLQRERQRWNAAFRGAEKSQHRRMVGVPQSGMGSDRPQE